MTDGTQIKLKSSPTIVRLLLFLRETTPTVRLAHVAGLDHGALLCSTPAGAWQIDHTCTRRGDKALHLHEAQERSHTDSHALRDHVADPRCAVEGPPYRSAAVHIPAKSDHHSKACMQPGRCQPTAASSVPLTGRPLAGRLTFASCMSAVFAGRSASHLPALCEPPAGHITECDLDLHSFQTILPSMSCRSIHFNARNHASCARLGCSIDPSRLALRRMLAGVVSSSRDPTVQETANTR